MKTNMRKLILKMSMSLDGFVAGPNYEADWIFSTHDDKAKQWTIDWIWKAGAHAMGALTFGDMASYWPTSSEPFAPPMNEIPKVVFSRKGKGNGPLRHTQAFADAQKQAPPPAKERAGGDSWDHARWMVGDLEKSVATLKAEDGKPVIAHGGASLARALIALDVVDEYLLLVHPVTLGKGHAIFSDASRRLMRLEEATAFPKGSVGHHYVRAR